MRYLKKKVRLLLKNMLVVMLLLFWTLTGLFPLNRLPFISRFQVEAADVTIDGSATATTTDNNGASSTVVFTSDQTGYAFYKDSDGRCGYSKTTDGGANWGAQVDVDSQTDCIHLAVWYDQWTPGDTTGTNIYIITMDTGADDLWYNSLDTSSDTLSKGTSPVAISSSPGPALTNALATGGSVPAITKSTTGVIYAGVSDASGGWVLKCSTTCGTASNWSDTSLDLSTLTQNDNDSLMLMPLASGDILCIYMSDPADDMLSKVYSDAGASWDTNWTTIDASAANNTTYDGHFGATVDKRTNAIYIAYATDNNTLGTNDDIRTAIYSAGSWTSKTDVLTNSSLGITGAKIAIDDSTGYVYVVYTARTTAATTTTGNIYYKKSTDGMASWGAQSSALQTTAADIYGARVNLLSDERIYVSWWQSSTLHGNTVVDLTPPTFEQSAYRLFDNDNATTVTTAFAAQDTAYTLTTSGQAFRLRMLMHITATDGQIKKNYSDFKLQYVDKGAGTCASPSGSAPASYTDVTTSTLLAYNNNASPADGDALTANGSLDPTDGGDTIVNQTYEELNNFANTQASIADNQDGKWDFSLYDNGAAASTAYCFRIVESDNTVLNTYTVYPQVTTSTAAANTYTQQAYRLFDNINTTGINSALASQDTAGSLTLKGQAFRLRLLLRNDTASLSTSGIQLKLQYSVRSGTCDTSFTGESYADVTTGTAISYFDNATPSDDSALTANATLDPTDGGRSIINQSYEENNNFTNSQATIGSGEDGKWDFALYDNGAAANTVYCLRVVKSSGSALLDAYTVIPQITTAAAPIVEQSGYRIFANNNGTSTGSPIGPQNSYVTLSSTSLDFRLRILLHLSTSGIATSSQSFKLQYAAKGTGTCSSPTGGTPSSYTDVTTSTLLAYKDNASPSDGSALTTSSTDPTHSSDTIVPQTYEELNNFTNSQSNIAAGADGLWDFALYDNGASAGATYCFRIVTDTSTVLDTYSYYPELTTRSVVLSTPSYVQSNLNKTGSQVASLANSFTSSVTSGNLVVVAVSEWNSFGDASVSSVVDNYGNSYSLAVENPTAQNGNEPVAVYYAYNVTGGTGFQVTVNLANNGAITTAIYEYTGISTTSDPLDRTANSSGTGSNGSSGSTATTTVANELVFGAFNHSSTSTTATAGTDFLMREYNDDNNTFEALYTEDRIVTATGAYSATITFGASVPWRGVVATFKAASGSVSIDSLMRHGKYFNSSGDKQPFTF